MTDEQTNDGLAPDGELKTTSFFGQTNFTAFLPLFRGSVGSIATRYGLDSPGSNSGREGFFASAQTGPGTHRVSFVAVKQPMAFPYGNGMVLHFYQQQESSTTKTVHKVINKGLKTYV